MDISRFFIDRPRFAGVLSIFIFLIGLLSIFNLPISEYPEVAPPQIVVASGTGGALAGSGSFVDIHTATGADAGSIVLSACQHSEDGTHIQLRVFNPDPLPATASLSVGGKTTSAATVDFLDQAMADLPVADGAATLTVRGHGIATIRFNQ